MPPVCEQPVGEVLAQPSPEVPLAQAMLDAAYEHVADREREHPAVALGGGSGILLGGPKYAAYEVEPGARLQSRSGDTD
jgi:hypothetical protein